MNFKEEMKQKVGEVENIITGYLPKEEGFQKTIFESMNYSVLAGGKRLRPLIMQECCRLFGRDSKEIGEFMAAIEMIHTSSLVHDDLPAMDADEYRRGRKTTWVVYGEDMAILAGDALMIYAFETAAKAFAKTDRPDLVGRCIGILAEKTGWNVANEGMNGREIPKTPFSFPMDADLLIIMLGTNDLLQFWTPKSACEKMGHFLESLTLPRDKVLLIAPPPMQLGDWVQDQKLINDSITLAKGYRCLTECLGIRFADAGEWNIPIAYDGVHLTEEGHRSFAKGLIQYLHKGE